jgi:hypothetical protein
MLPAPDVLTAITEQHARGGQRMGTGLGPTHAIALLASGGDLNDITRFTRCYKDLNVECTRFFKSRLFLIGCRPSRLSFISSQTCSSGLRSGL